MAFRPGSVGEPIKRREDPRLIRGLGTYTDDVKLHGTVFAAFVRSDFAAGVVKSIDTSSARDREGVIDVFTYDDMRDGVGCTPVGAELPPEVMNKRDHPLLADGVVRYVGQPLSVVIADSAYAARDAALEVVADIEPRPAVADLEEALEDGAPKVYEELGTNVCFALPAPNEETERLFQEADGSLDLKLVNHRVAPFSMEGRAVVAHWEDGPGKLTVWTSTQAPHIVKQQMAICLRIPEIRVRIVAPEVGGGFGCKIPTYPEECVLGWASRRLRRPIRWSETRRREPAQHVSRTGSCRAGVGCLSFGRTSPRVTGQDDRRRRRVPFLLRSLHCLVDTIDDLRLL